MAKWEDFGPGSGMRGRMGDLVFYKLGEKTVVRRVGVVSKKRYRTDPAYKRVRENNNYFGLASRLGKTLRLALRDYLPEWTTARTSGKLTGCLLKMLKQGQGKLIAGEPDLIFDAGLDAGKALLSCGKPFHFKCQEGELYLRMGFGKLRKLFGENPFPLKLVLGVVALSDVSNDPVFHALHPDWHGQAAFKTHQWSGAWPEKGELRLKVRLKGKQPVPEDVLLIGVLGVVSA